MLAPLEDITSNAFRSICNKNGADLTFTELTKIESIIKENKSSLSKIKLEDDTPVHIQLLGSKEDSFKKFLNSFKPSKGFKGFNLNLGSPNPRIISIGQGCAMIKRITKIKKIIKIISSAGYETSIKLRLGINDFEKKKKVYLNLINSVDANFFIVHARCGTQTYKDPADFSVYSECVDTGKNIIANGDIKSKEDVKLVKEYGVKGVMIGRAAVINPGIFNLLKDVSSAPKEELIAEFIKLSKSYKEDPKYANNVVKYSKDAN